MCAKTGSSSLHCCCWDKLQIWAVLQRQCECGDLCQNLSDSRVDIKLCLWVPKVKNIWGVFQFCKDSVSVVTCVRFMGRSISNFASGFQKLQIWSVETVQCVLTCSVSDSIQNQLQLQLKRNSSQPRFQPRTLSTDHDVLLFCYLPRVYNVKLKLHCTWYCIYAIYWTPDSSKCVQVFTENAQIEWFGLLFKAHLTFMRGWGQR